MRILLDRLPGPSLASYRRFVYLAQVRGLMADHLVRGEPYLALNALVLTGTDVEQLQRLTETFARAFQRAGEIVKSDTSLAVEMGFPWIAAELLAAEEPRTPVVGRFDFARDRDGQWWLLEYNADTPSGIREATVVDEIAHSMLPEARGLTRPNERLTDSLINAFACSVRGLGSAPRLGIVTSAGELEDLAQMVFTRDLIRDALGRVGADVVLGDAENLRQSGRGLTLCGHPIGALYRYVPFEAILGTECFSIVAEASGTGRLRLLNGLFGLLLQNKAMLAWLWAHRHDPRLEPELRTVVCEHLPPTWMIDEHPADEPRERLVAKQVFGREGEEVVFGEDASAERWDVLRRHRTYVVQRCVDVADYDGVVRTSTGAERMRGRPTVGSYTIAGAWGGFYTRFGGKITTSRAKWLATFAE